MSITPAFSPGPWITHGAFVGSVRKWTLDDLYEQCSFHIAEKMPSSVNVGVRPISALMRSYSSGVRPWAAISADVMRGVFASIVTTNNLVPVAATSERAARSGRLLEMINEAREQPAPVGRAHGCFHVILRMRHQAEHVAALV